VIREGGKEGGKGMLTQAREKASFINSIEKKSRVAKQK